VWLDQRKKRARGAHQEQGQTTRKTDLHFFSFFSHELYAV